MRRAITFFAVSTGLFLSSQALVLLAGGGSEVTAGIISIVLALFYVAFPIFSTKALALLPVIPLSIVVAFLTVAGSLVLALLCITVFLFPAVLAYFAVPVAYKEFGTTWAIILTISFITAWLLVRKYQIRLIGEIGEFTGKLYKQIVEPIINLIRSIWKRAEKIGEAVCK